MGAINHQFKNEWDTECQPNNYHLRGMALLHPQKCRFWGWFTIGFCHFRRCMVFLQPSLGSILLYPTPEQHRQTNCGNSSFNPHWAGFTCIYWRLLLSWLRVAPIHFEPLSSSFEAAVEESSPNKYVPSSNLICHGHGKLHKMAHQHMIHKKKKTW